MMNNLDKRIKIDIANGVFPGMVYAIVEEKINKKAIGYKSIYPYKENTTMNTLYDLASLTKVIVVVTIISKLLDQNKIKLTDKTNNYLNQFKYDDVTIYHLLTHTSGLVNKKISKLEDIYKIEKEYETGSKVVYTDVGYMLLGLIIEKIYNKSLDEVAKEEVFMPLEMYNTCYNPKIKQKCAPTEVVKGEIIQGIVHDRKARLMNGVAGHAGVFSDVSDLVHFVQMILNNGTYKGKKFLSKRAIDLWFKNLVYEEENKITRSLCWITGINKLIIKNGKNVISFSGFTGPSISIDREKKIGIIFLTNRVHPTRKNIKYFKERSILTSKIYEDLQIKEK